VAILASAALSDAADSLTANNLPLAVGRVRAAWSASRPGAAAAGARATVTAVGARPNASASEET